MKTLETERIGIGVSNSKFVFNKTLESGRIGINISKIKLVCLVAYDQ